MRLSHPSSGPPRQGVILLVVVLMLTLFLVVGLTFVLYSESAATGSRINKEAQTPDMVDVLPETLLSWGLGKFIYDETDDINGVPSAIRGHSLARLTWGWNYFESSAATPNPIFTNNNFPSDLTLRNTDPYSRANVTPFNGIGPLRALAAPPAAAGPGITDYDLINYTWFAQRDATGTPISIDGFLRDPERAQYRQDASKVPAVNQPLQSYAGGFNVPYTYPDRANMMLAAVQTTVIDPTTHQPVTLNPPRLIAQSGFRPTANISYGMIDPTTNAGTGFWVNTLSTTYPNSPAFKTWWKYAVLRPRPGDQLLAGETLMPSPTGNGWIAQNTAGNIRPAFPPPADAGGDVKQLPGVQLFVLKDANGNFLPAQQQPQNDSFWMDLNYPVQISRNGKKFKPLFAFLVLDLDGRLNLNMAGNASAVVINNNQQFIAHASNQGLGRYEINISKVLNADQTASTLPAEWRNVFTGSIAVPSYAGRYGQDKTPGYTAFGTNNAITDPWAPDLTTNSETLRSLIFPCDIDGVDPANNRQVTTKFTLPFTTFASFPTFSPTGYDNCTFDATKPLWNPRLNHPLLNQKLRAFGDDLPFGDDNMYSLLAGDYRKSYLYSLIPQNLDGTAAAPTLGMRNRQLLTTRSYDLDMPGIPPWVTSSTASAYQFTPLPGLASSVVNATNHPSGQPMPTPAPAQMVSLAALAAKANDNSDFKANDGRANLLSRVDLNRKLTPYFDATGKFVPPLDAKNNHVPQPPASALMPGLLTTNPEYRYYVATNDRQQLALDIFNRLVQVTGAASMGRVQAGTASQPELAAVRWLAQLAVNIVDYVDDDDIITPFVWNPINPNNPNDPANFAPDQIAQRVVFGVEAPKLVVNQAYSELQNDPTDTTAATSGAKLPYQYNFWLELYNPMSVASPPTALSTKNPPTADRQDPNKGSQDRLAVQLQRTSQTLGGAYPVYQVQIVDEAKSPSTFLAQPGNMDGSVNPMGVMVQVTSYLPDFNAVAQAPPGSATPYPDFTFVQPNIGTFIIPTNAGANTPPSNSGFYVMGPDSKHPFNQPQQGGGVTLHPTINLQDQGQTSQIAAATPWGQPKGGTAKNAMTYQYQGPIQMTDPKDMAARKHTVLLRRLACPNLDPNPIDPQTKGLVDQTKPFNPYVTVDYMAGVPTFDAVQYTSQGPAPFNKNTDYQQPTQRSSVGRVQPYNAAVVKVQKSAAPNPVNNTFFQHNSTSPPPGPMSGSTNNQQGGPTLDWPFDWLTFADRPLTNVAEVMNVPSTAPHMLTQAFGFNPITKQRDLSNHLAPWGVQEARIYRALEYFTVGDRSPYPGTLGRVTAKVNLNTIFDAATLDAIIDAQPNSNFFTQQAVQDVWQGNGDLTDTNNTSFLNRKQQLLVASPKQLDKPFMSFAAPVQAVGDAQYPLGSGIANTMAPYPVQVNGKPAPGGTFTPQTANTPSSIAYTPPEKSLPIPPYILNELLTKIGGHSTNRSNTFAVFLTVGFFEVIDDTSLPVKLGAEITSAGGKAIRHQMFSVVDRTNLAIDAGRALDPGINDPAGRLRQPPTPPTFMSLTDGIPAGAGAPTAKGKPATPITVAVNGSLPIDYDGTTPVTFKPYQVPPNTAAPTYWPTTSTGQTCQWMFLETGAHQEAVQVTMDATGTKLQLLFPNGAQFSHPAGSMLCTYQPGNPGPQGPIDYASPQYRAVVPYTYIIQ
jgi:hypothetical protein